MKRKLFEKSPLFSTVKWIFVVVLCAAMLSACAPNIEPDTDSNSIVGTWETDQISVLGIELPDDESKDENYQQYQFNEDLTGADISTIFGNRTENAFTYTLSESENEEEVTLTYESGITQTFTYHVEGNTLTLSQGARTGEWKRV